MRSGIIFQVEDKTFSLFNFVILRELFRYFCDAGNENWDDEGLESTPIIEGIDNSYAHIVPVCQNFKPDKRGVKVRLFFIAIMDNFHLLLVGFQSFNSYQFYACLNPDS
jgi:hypothetical protein